MRVARKKAVPLHGRTYESNGESGVSKEDIKASIIIPTYNEVENIEPLINKIHQNLRESYQIVVVDDNSPDGTGEIAEELGRHFPVRVLHRQGRLGLASAVLAGLRVAQADIVGVMDADLQHPPEVATRLLDAVSQGADIAIASRYVSGGRCEDRSFLRTLITKLAILSARPLVSANDPMSGFFFVRRKVMESVTLKPRGYKILLEILVKANYENAAEVPYTFSRRKSGESKLGFKVVFNYLQQLSGLYFFRLRRLTRLCILFCN